MLKQGVFIGLGLLLAACTHLHKTEPSGLMSLSAQPTQLQTVSNFNRVKINGRFNVHIHTGSLRPTLLVHGDPRDVSHVQWVVKHHGDLREPTA